MLASYPGFSLEATLLRPGGEVTREIVSNSSVKTLSGNASITIDVDR